MESDNEVMRRAQRLISKMERSTAKLAKQMKQFKETLSTMGENLEKDTSDAERDERREAKNLSFIMWSPTKECSLKEAHRRKAETPALEDLEISSSVKPKTGDISFTAEDYNEAYEEARARYLATHDRDYLCKDSVGAEEDPDTSDVERDERREAKNLSFIMWSPTKECSQKEAQKRKAETPALEDLETSGAETDERGEAENVSFAMWTPTKECSQKRKTETSALEDLETSSVLGEESIDSAYGSFFTQKEQRKKKKESEILGDKDEKENLGGCTNDFFAAQEKQQKRMKRKKSKAERKGLEKSGDMDEESVGSTCGFSPTQGKQQKQKKARKSKAEKKESETSGDMDRDSLDSTYGFFAPQVKQRRQKKRKKSKAEKTVSETTDGKRKKSKSKGGPVATSTPMASPQTEKSIQKFTQKIPRIEESADNSSEDTLHDDDKDSMFNFFLGRMKARILLDGHLKQYQKRGKPIVNLR